MAIPTAAASVALTLLVERCSRRRQEQPSVHIGRAVHGGVGHEVRHADGADPRGQRHFCPHAARATTTICEHLRSPVLGVEGSYPVFATGRKKLFPKVRELTAWSFPKVRDTAPFVSNRFCVAEDIHLRADIFGQDRRIESAALAARQMDPSVQDWYVVYIASVAQEAT